MDEYTEVEYIMATCIEDVVDYTASDFTTATAEKIVVVVA